MNTRGNNISCNHSLSNIPRFPHKAPREVKLSNLDSVFKIPETIFHHTLFSLPPERQWGKRLRKGQDWQTYLQIHSRGKTKWLVYQNKTKCQEYVKKAEKESHTLNQLKPLRFSRYTLICRGNMVLGRFTSNFRPTIQRKQKDKSGVPGRLRPHMQNSIPGKNKFIRSQNKGTVRT